MANNGSGSSPGLRQPAPTGDLLLREMQYRCGNGLQLVVSLLALPSRRAASPEVRQALAEAMERVAVLTRARATPCTGSDRSAFQRRCGRCAKRSRYAEPRPILIVLEASTEALGPSANQVTTLALVVNELTMTPSSMPSRMKGPAKFASRWIRTAVATFA